MEKAKEIADVISDYVNTFDSRAIENLVDQMTRVHRTLQQNFTRLCVAWFQKLAEPDFWFDPRNEASVMLARKLKTVLDETYLPYI